MQYVQKFQKRGHKSAIKMIKNLWFWIGLSIRLVLLVFLAPTIQSDWFIPFLQNSIQTVSMDPWSDFLGIGGDHFSFPYGVLMVVVFFSVLIIVVSNVLFGNRFVIIKLPLVSPK